MVIQFSPAGYGTAVRNSEVAKSRWARPRRKTSGRLIRRVTKPVLNDVDDAMTRQRDAFAGQADRFVYDAGRTINRESKRAAQRLGVGVGVGAGVGVGSGIAAGSYAKKKINDQKVTKSSGMRSAPITDYPAGTYNYLLPTLRSDIAAIPGTRRNPISPIHQAAAAAQVASGYGKVKSINPFFRRRRRRQGFTEILSGRNMNIGM